MSILSNINGKFAVDSTGAIQFSGQTGTSGYVLKSNGNAAPTWVDGSTVIGGPYLPLSGGILTGATATASGISFTVGGVLTGTSATFSGDVSVEDNLYLTDAGTVRGKIQLNSSDRDDLDIKVVSLGSNMKFFTVDIERMRIDSDGRIMINQSSNITGQALQVNGFIDITKSTSNAIRFFDNTTFRGGLGLDSWATGGSASNITMFCEGEFGIVTGGGNTKKLVMDTSGNVGIGTTAPDNKLTVKAANCIIDAQSTADSQTIGFRAGYLNHGTLAGFFRYTTGDAQLYIDNEFVGNNAVYSDINFRNKTTGGTLTTRMKIKGSTGNIGIGTTAPDAKFQVQGNVKVGSASGASWTDAKDDVGGLDVFVGSGSNAFSVWDDNAQTIPRFLVSRAGNVGIGGAAGVKFEVYSGSLRVRGSSANLIELSNINGNTRAALGNYGNEGDLSLYRSNNVKTVYLSSYYNSYINPDGGNLGIGTTSPNKRLTVYGGNDNGIWIDSQGGQYTSLAFGHNGTEKANIAWDNTNGYTNITTYASGHLAMSTGGGIKAFLNSSGNFGIGTTSPNALLSTADSNSYTQEWTFAKGYRHSTTYPAGSTGNYNISTKISFNNLRGITVDYYESGHLFNNGAAVYFRHTRFYIMMEGSTLRINDAVLIRSTGNRTDAIVNAPAVTTSASLECLITSTIKSGFTHYVAADIVGTGFNRIVSIS